MYCLRVPGKHRGEYARAEESYVASGAEASRRMSIPVPRLTHQFKPINYPCLPVVPLSSLLIIVTDVVVDVNWPPLIANPWALVKNDIALNVYEEIYFQVWREFVNEKRRADRR